MEAIIEEYVAINNFAPLPKHTMVFIILHGNTIFSLQSKQVMCQPREGIKSKQNRQIITLVWLNWIVSKDCLPPSVKSQKFE